MEDINLIRKMAWDFSQASNIEFDELFSEASLAYCEALKHWETGKGAKFSTFAWRCMRNRLLDFSDKDYRKSRRTYSLDDFFEENDDEEIMPEALIFEERNDTWQEIQESWSKECQEIAALVLSDPEWFVGESPNFKRKKAMTPKQKVRHQLTSRGWKQNEINQGIKSMKEALLTL